MNLKDSLLESTMLALQGKLNLNENKTIGKKAKKTESIDVSIDDNGATIVETDDATVIVTDIEKEETTEAPVVEVPVEGDETIIPEEVVEPETVEEPVEELPTIDEIVDGETEADKEDLDESKKSCEECGNEVCECNKVEENINDDFAKAKELLAVIFDANATEATREDAKNSLKTLIDTKKVEEDVEIEISEDGQEVEVTVDEGEVIEVKDETPEDAERPTIETDDPEDENEETEVEEPTEDNEEEVEDEFDEDSFAMALENYYKENMKMAKSFKVEKINKEDKNLKIEGKLINKFGKEYNINLEAKLEASGRFYSQYNIINDKLLKENKETTKITMLTKLKENKLYCTQIKAKSLIK